MLDGSGGECMAEQRCSPLVEKQEEEEGAGISLIPSTICSQCPKFLLKFLLSSSSDGLRTKPYGPLGDNSDPDCSSVLIYLCVIS